MTVAGQRPRAWVGAVAGLLTAAVAMGVAQLFAGLTIPQASPVIAVGQAAINLTPDPVKNFAIAAFGSHDKDVLLGGILVVVFILAGVVGALSVRRLEFGMWGLAVFGVIGLAAALTRPGSTPAYLVPAIAGGIAGAVALRAIVRRAYAGLPGPQRPRVEFGTDQDGRNQAARDEGSTDQAARDKGSRDEAGGNKAGSDQAGRTRGGGDEPGTPGGGAAGEPVPGTTADSGDDRLSAPDLTPARLSPAPVLTPGPVPLADRRGFLTSASVAAAAAAVSALAGRELSAGHNVSKARAAIRFPRAAVPAPPLPRGIDLGVPGLPPFITPNGQFYRVDTALLPPQVAPSSWTLRIHGLVEREIEIDFGDLLRRPLIEDYITLTCVSNPVGGPYAGNAKWLGASLASLLRAARPRAGASQLISTSVDGFTCGTPLEVVMDGRDALVAVAMNGTALPVAHGFPARLVVPGLYGYVSACKWVTDIEVTTFEAATAYWVQQGWSQQAPIKTESRIDVPAGGAALRPGKVAVAGEAWAQHKGIDAVEVRVDSGPWNVATLAPVPDIDCWRQWVWQWEATPGQHTIEARATDKTGYTQTAAQAPVEPNGATGYPSVPVTVSRA